MKLFNFVGFMSIDDIVEFYARMALKPGWLDYARHEAKEMEQSPYFKGIAKLIAKRIEELKVESR